MPGPMHSIGSSHLSRSSRPATSLPPFPQQSGV